MHDDWCRAEIQDICKKSQTHEAIFMYDYRSLTDAINDLALEYKSGKENSGGILRRIESRLFEYTYFMIIDKARDEDSASMFFVENIMPKIRMLLDAYDSEKGTFVDLFASFCYANYRYYKLKTSLEDASDRSISNFAKAGLFFGDDEYLNDAFSDGTGLFVEEPEEKYSHAEKPKIKRSAYSKRKVTNNDRIGFVIYILRHASCVDSDVIDNVADFLGIGKETIYSLVEEAKTLLESRSDAVNYHIEKKNSYFMKANLLMQRLSVADDKAEAVIERKIARYRRLQEEHGRRIRLLLTVSEIDISEIMNIRYETVRKLLYKAKRTLLRMKAAKDSKGNEIAEGMLGMRHCDRESDKKNG